MLSKHNESATDNIRGVVNKKNYNANPVSRRSQGNEDARPNRELMARHFLFQVIDSF